VKTVMRKNPSGILAEFVGKQQEIRAANYFAKIANIIRGIRLIKNKKWLKENKMEFLLELIPPKLFGFLLAAVFIAAGTYMWMSGSAVRAEYDLAVGSQSKTYQAEIRRKVVRSESSSGINDHDTGTINVNYLDLSYEEDSKYKSIDAQVERDEYDAVKEGDRIKISFHPDNPNYVVTPLKERPGVIWYRIGGGIFILLGVIFILMILASLAG